MGNVPSFPGPSALCDGRNSFSNGGSAILPGSIENQKPRGSPLVRFREDRAERRVKAHPIKRTSELPRAQGGHFKEERSSGSLARRRPTFAAHHFTTVENILLCYSGQSGQADPGITTGRTYRNTD